MGNASNGKKLLDLQLVVVTDINWFEKALNKCLQMKAKKDWITLLSDGRRGPSPADGCVILGAVWF